jgi:hypothetical protein
MPRDLRRSSAANSPRSSVAIPCASPSHTEPHLAPGSTSRTRTTYFASQSSTPTRPAASPYPSGSWSPTQTLRELTGGQVFHDGTGLLDDYRGTLAWYPDDVWRYVLACQWKRLAQEEAFVGRCGEVGDEVGSAVVAARQVRDLMKLCLLMARVYPPYSKWLGTAFAKLPCADALTPVFADALAARTWKDRERHLSSPTRSSPPSTTN